MTDDIPALVARLERQEAPMTNDRDAVVRLLRETVDALENIESDARTPQVTYDRVGPTWTGKDGHEYADMDHLLDKCNELADSIHTVIEKAALALAAADAFKAAPPRERDTDGGE